MVLMPLILSLGILLGVSLLAYGLLFLNNGNAAEVDSESINMIQQSISDAENTLSNINSVSSLIIEEIDIKYKELLFLYQMIEEKKREIAKPEITDKKMDYLITEEEFPRLNNREMIIEMAGRGMSVTDIAKELNIGKGEAELIIGLNKVGV